MKELIEDAIQLLQDRPEVIELLDWAFKLPEAERAAIIFAIQFIKEEEGKDERR